ncbi:integrase family protein [Marinovum sp.]|uniref:integrase family protein n=1 Tax=Marinovum sp. TaxID=2024839 RepID=UPI002B276487|nr:integrase family protein [Marinovum sp.]
MPEQDFQPSLNVTEKLTETRLKAKRWEGKSYQVRDASLPGFFAEVNKNRTSLKIQADLWVGETGRKIKVRTVRHTLGQVGEIPLTQAKLLAAEYLHKIKAGIDPFATEKAPIHHWSHRELIENYIDECIDRDLRDATVNGYRKSHRLYLSDWDSKPANSIKKSDARLLFKKLTESNGKIAANKAMRLMSAAHNWAKRLDDENIHFDINPIEGVTLHTERGKNRSLLPEELPSWKDKLDALENPIRREMHYINLYSGLRTRTILQTQKDWIDKRNSVIHFPGHAMKSRRDFDMPMSRQILHHVERALNFSDTLFPGSPWLFPTWSRKDKKIIHSAVIREKTMPSLTGRILRKTHRTFAERIKISKVNARLLLDHAVPDIDGVYIDDQALFQPLMRDQQAISDEIEKNLQL